MAHKRRFDWWRSAGIASLCFGAIGCDDEAGATRRHDAGTPVFSDAAADETDVIDAEEELDAGLGDAELETDSDAGTSGPARVTLRFRGKVGASDYGCDRIYLKQGKTGASVSGRDFRFVVHDVRLINREGEEVPFVLDERPPSQNAQLALLNFQDPEGTCGGAGPGATQVTGSVPEGDYRGIAFVVGVPEALNHSDPALATAPLKGSGLSWDWLQGYRFFVGELASTAPIDASVGDAGAGDAGAGDAGAGDAGAGDAGLATDGGSADASSHDFEPGLGRLHLGSTGCVGSPAKGISCAKANRAQIRLLDLDPTTDVIVADLGAVFVGVDLEQGVQCHARGEFCAPMFSALGIDLSTGAALPTQTLFRVE